MIAVASRVFLSQLWRQYQMKIGSIRPDHFEMTSIVALRYSNKCTPSSKKRAGATLEHGYSDQSLGSDGLGRAEQQRIDGLPLDTPRPKRPL